MGQYEVQEIITAIIRELRMRCVFLWPNRTHADDIVLDVCIYQLSEMHLMIANNN